MKIITRKQAKELGLTRYFTGKPCKYGHISERNTGNGTCQECHYTAQKDYFKKHKKKITEKSRIYRREKYRNDAEYRRKIRESVNKEKESEKHKEYYQKNKERLKEKARKRREEKGHDTEYFRKYMKKRRNTATGKIEIFLRNALRRLMIATSKEKEISSKIIDYSVSDFKKHIESQFLEGMNWDNYGDWHIDHKIPMKYLIKKYEGFSQKELHGIINRLDNLRPMWATDNLAKSSKLTEEVNLFS